MWTEKFHWTQSQMFHCKLIWKSPKFRLPLSFTVSFFPAAPVTRFLMIAAKNIWKSECWAVYDSCELWRETREYEFNCDLQTVAFDLWLQFSIVGDGCWLTESILKHHQFLNRLLLTWASIFIMPFQSGYNIICATSARENTNLNANERILKEEQKIQVIK